MKKKCELCGTNIIMIKHYPRMKSASGGDIPETKIYECPECGCEYHSEGNHKIVNSHEA